MRRASWAVASCLVLGNWCGLALAQTPTPTTAIGTTPGSFDVTLAGTASYTIPIKVAPGTAGLEPSIQFSYDSQSPGGALGGGWSLSGLSAITRGPKDQFTDSESGGITLTESDAFYLDGQRLIPISKSGSGTNRVIEYRKSFDDLTRIVQTGADFGSSVFRAQTKGGITVIFDGSNGSRVNLANNSTLVMAESRVFDTAGNYIEFHYVDNNQGDYNIESIKYAGNEQRDSSGRLVSGRRPYASVEFKYDPVPRPWISYVAGQQLVRQVRLSSVESLVADHPDNVTGASARTAQRYELGYKDTNSPSRFLLSSIKEFGDDGTQLLPTTFNYSSPPLGWGGAPFSFPNSAVMAGYEHLGAAYRFRHFAPTGSLPDLLFATQVEGKLQAFAFRNDGLATAGGITWTAMPGFAPPIAFNSASGGDLGVIVEDISGTSQFGLALLQNYQQTGQPPSVATYFAGATKFDQQNASWNLPFVVSKDGKRVAKYYFGSWSGGAAKDILYEADGVAGFSQGGSSGWTNDSSHASPLPLDNHFHVIDIDCSGKPAILGALPDANGTLQWKVFRYGSVKWDPETNTAFIPPFPATTDPEAIREIKFGALPGGGCPGFIVATAAGAGMHASYVTSRTGWKPAGKVPNFDLVDRAGNPSGAIVADVADYHGSHYQDVISNKQFRDGSIVKFAYQQTDTGWQKLPTAFEPPLLDTAVPNALSPNVFVTKLDGVYGDDLILASDSRALPGDNLQEKFGQIFLSTPAGFNTNIDYAPPVQFARSDKQDRGVRLVDLHGTGLPDVLFSRSVTVNGSTTLANGASRNTGDGWSDELGMYPPVAFASDDIAGNPAQFADVDGDGFADLIYSNKGKDGRIESHLFLNVADVEVSRKWKEVLPGDALKDLIPPTTDPATGQELPLARYQYGDMGVRFLKLNKNRLAMLVGYMLATNKPVQKCTIDAHGVRHCSLDRSLFQTTAFVLEGNKWVREPSYAPPLPFVAQRKGDLTSADLFVQLVDVNGDGLPDIVAHFVHPYDSSVDVNEVWLNTGSGWQLAPYGVPYQLDMPLRVPKTTVQVVDVNGDGVPDIVVSQRNGGTNSSQTWLGTGKGWQSNPDPKWQIPLDAISDKDGDPGFRLVDVTGHGYLDVLYMRMNDDKTVTSGAFINNGTDWTTRLPAGLAPQLPFVDKDGLDQGVRLLSVTGKGLTDIVQSFAGAAPVVKLNTSRIDDVLVSITEGLGLSISINYQTLLELDGDPASGVPKNLFSDRAYERGKPDPFPLVSPVPTTYVVRRATVDEGDGKPVSFSYRYGNYRVDSMAMRSLGFGWRESLNEVNGVLSRTELVQDPRFQNAIKRDAVCWVRLNQRVGDSHRLPEDLCPPGDPIWSSWGQKLSESSNCWESLEGKTSNGSYDQVAICGSTPTPVTDYQNLAPYIVRQVGLTQASSSVFEADGGLVSSEVDSFDTDKPANLFDRHANNLGTRVTLSDGTSVETSSDYADNALRWFLGRVKKVVTKKVGDRVSSPSAMRKTETRTVEFSYSESTGQLQKQTADPDNAQGVSTSYDRDVYGNITSATVSAVGEQSRVSYSKYDDLGRFVISSTNAVGHRVSRVVDSASGRPTAVTDANGLTTRMEYDGFARLTKQVNPSGVAITTKVISLDDLRAYFPTIDVTKGVAVKFARVAQLATLPPIWTLYDDKVRPVRTISDTFTLDASSHRYVFKDTGYDRLGRVARKSLKYPNDGSPIWATNDEYDVFNRVTQATSYDGVVTRSTFSSTPSAASSNNGIFKRCQASGSDARVGGSVTSVVVDPTGLARKSYSRVNMRNELLYAVDGEGGCVSYEYDAGGRIQKMVGAAGAVTIYDFDTLGRKIGTSDPDLGNWQYSYDPFGDVTEQIDPKNQISTMEYDRGGRPIRKVQTDVSTRWTYDVAKNGIGKVAFIENSNGYEESYFYDSLSRNDRTAVRIHDEQFVRSRSYDELDRPIAEFYPSSFAIRNVYDAKGFLTGVADLRDGTNYWTAKEIDIYGHVVEETYGNGVTTLRDFDTKTGRPTNLRALRNSGAPVMNLSLKYDKIGNLLERTESVDRKNEQFQYDALDRLATMRQPGGVAHRYAFDSAGRIVFKDDVGSYVYPANQGQTDGDFAKPLNAVLETHSGQRIDQYRYDRNGNMVSSPEASYEYTSDNLVKLAYSNDRLWSRFDYGPRGDRFRQIARNGNQTFETIYVGDYERITDFSVLDTQKRERLTRSRHYLHNGSGVFAAVETDAEYASSAARTPTPPASCKDVSNAGCSKTIQIWCDGHLISVPASANWFHSPQPPVRTVVAASSRRTGETSHRQTWYFHLDQLQSIIRITDDNAKLRDDIWYDPWGKRQSRVTEVGPKSEALGNSWTRGFTGAEHLDAFSLVHMNGRALNTRLGAFTSVDPINQSATDTQSGNGYMYARGNPLRYVDPTGNGWISDFFHNPGKALGQLAEGAWNGIKHFANETGKWFSENWKTVVVVVAVIAVTVVTAGALGPEAFSIGGSILIGAAAGATASGLTAALYGGSLSDVLGAAVEGAVIGGITGALTGGVNEYFSGLARTQGTLTLSQEIESVAAHGVVGGARGAVLGQNFWSGFAGAAAAEAFRYAGPKFTSTAANTVKAALEGGTVAAISHGSFANGAIAGALDYAMTPNSAEGPVKERITDSKFAVAFVGGLADTDLGDAGPVYQAYMQYTSENPGVTTAYFAWNQGDVLAIWIDQNDAFDNTVAVIGHSYGGDTAAYIVSQGHQVDVLVTADPVSWWRPDYEAVRANAGIWVPYYATGGSSFETTNVIGSLGGAWRSNPPNAVPVPATHGGIMDQLFNPAH